MAIFKVINSKGKYHDDDALSDVNRYVLKPYKTQHKYTGGIHVDMNDPAGSMDTIAEHYKKRRGVRLRHFIVAFTEDECPSPIVADSIGGELIEWLGEEYQSVYAVHEDSNEVHLHIVFNSVSYVDGHKYHGSKSDYYDMLYTVKAILRRYGIKKVIPKKK